eukprot:COSAG06_NODE_2174_length_7412_cov_4.617394_5_plen_150_part_00
MAKSSALNFLQFKTHVKESNLIMMMSTCRHMQVAGRTPEMQDQLQSMLGKGSKNTGLCAGDVTVAHAVQSSTATLAQLRLPRRRCGKRHFLRHLYIKPNILSRQARDRHRENSKKSGVLSKGGCEVGRVPSSCVLLLELWSFCSAVSCS